MTQEQAARLEALIASWRRDAEWARKTYETASADSKMDYYFQRLFLGQCADELESALSALRALREGTTDDVRVHVKPRQVMAYQVSAIPVRATPRPYNTDEWLERKARDEEGHDVSAGGAVPASPIEASSHRDVHRCAVCGWPLVHESMKGCARGNCSLRPFPDRFYDPERAKAEYYPYLNDHPAVRAAHAVPSVSSPEKNTDDD